jgi:DNA-binding CsgD family transcriptional regulator
MAGSTGYRAVMPAPHPWRQMVEELRKVCGDELDAVALARAALSVIRRHVPVDAGFVSAVDPATMLFTQPLCQEISTEAIPLFLHNELAEPDVAKFRKIAAAGEPVEWLDRATKGRWDDSLRYRAILRPLGLGDELRVALRTGDTCWAVMCLHRERACTGFTADEAAGLAAGAGHLGAAFRRCILEREDQKPLAVTVDLPALLVLDARDAVLSYSAGAQRWLEELTGPQVCTGLPLSVRAVVGQLHAGSGEPRLQLRTRAGGWVCVRATSLHGASEAKTAVVIEPVRGQELAPMIVATYGLTRRESEVLSWVLRGRSNRQIANALRISEYTVQDHLKAIYLKTGVCSRAELPGRIFADNYWAH